MAIDTIGTNAITNDAINAAKIADGAVDADLGPVHSVISVKGTIINSVATTITIEIGGKFASSVDVKYLTSGGTVIATDSSRTVTNGTLTSAVPSAVYSGYSAGNIISIKIASDSVDSANSVEKTVITAPTGGTITTSGDYRIHTFNSSGNFVVAANTLLKNVEYLVIGGGGGGGYHTANGYYYDSVGGGGAGGYRCSVPGETSGGGVAAEPPISYLTSGTYECQVGAGGAAAGSTGQGGGAGTHSVFGGSSLESYSSPSASNDARHSFFYGNPERSQNPIQSSTGSLPIMSHGGGASVSVCWNPPQLYRGGNGGSGGGSGTSSGGSTLHGVNLPRQGYISGTLDNVQAGAAGGGAGGAGAAINSSNKGTTNNYNGGAGLTSSITGSAVARGGGGGAGGTAATGHSQTGGTATGGGGNGGNYNGGANGVNGAANTGGGAGGSGASSSASGYASGAGGSGVIILRYKLNEVDNF